MERREKANEAFYQMLLAGDAFFFGASVFQISADKGLSLMVLIWLLAFVGLTVGILSFGIRVQRSFASDELYAFYRPLGHMIADILSTSTIFAAFAFFIHIQSKTEGFIWRNDSGTLFLTFDSTMLLALVLMFCCALILYSHYAGKEREGQRGGNPPKDGQSTKGDGSEGT